MFSFPKFRTNKLVSIINSINFKSRIITQNNLKKNYSTNSNPLDFKYFDYNDIKFNEPIVSGNLVESISNKKIISNIDKTIIDDQSTTNPHCDPSAGIELFKSVCDVII